jgi:hypothetical protein
MLVQKAAPALAAEGSKKQLHVQNIIILCVSILSALGAASIMLSFAVYALS